MSDCADLTALFAKMCVPLEVRETAELGKHVIAVSDIDEGTEIFEEVPLVSWPMPALLQSATLLPSCWHCLAIGSHSIRCNVCGATFCSDGCAGVGYHKVLCGLQIGNVDPTFPISPLSIARCVSVVVDRFNKLRRGAQLNADSARAIFEAAVRPFNRFVEPPPNSNFEEVDCLVWYSEVTQALGQKVREVLDGGDSLWVPHVVDGLLSVPTLHTILGQLTLNSQAVVNHDAASRALVPLLGGALFTLQSNFNHSCCPNAEVSNRSNHEILLTAKRAIRAGDEVTISYISDLSRLVEDATQRREKLKTYFFFCHCTRCKAEDEAKEKIRVK